MSRLALIRQAIIDAIPHTPANFGEVGEQVQVYIPPAHIKALRLESNLVVGARGVGKSFWTAALGSPSLRRMLGASVRELEHVEVRIGFAFNENISIYPSAETFSDLLAKSFTPYEVWRAVIARWAAEKLSADIPTNNWFASTEWVKNNPEEFSRLIQRANEHFKEQGVKGLIVFDSLDRSSHEWKIMDVIVRDLLRVVLWLKSYPAIHAKVFLREDQLERTVTDFPDASKLIAAQAELAWQPHDLHGLLWQLLCNEPNNGQILRDIYKDVCGSFPEQKDLVWLLEGTVKLESSKLRELFERLAGPWMGRDPRRGVPYVWSVSHLADGNGRTSPRSFLAAIRAAAEQSAEKYHEYTLPLHFESIKRGVQKASEIRIAEMAEDYPWVNKIFEPLRGVTVPCEFSVIEDRWNQRFEDLNTFNDKLPPQHIERGWPGVRDDLVRLGLFERMKDGRINMPDLYRVGFGLGRRGGVKPMK